MKTNCFIIILFLCSTGWAIKTEIRLSGEPERVRRQAETVLSQVLNACNLARETQAPLNPIQDCFTEPAFQDFQVLVDQTRLYATQRQYVSRLLQTQNGDFQVRGIRVRVAMGDTRGSPYQSLVFVLDNTATIVDVYFSVDEHHYETIVRQGEELKDLSYREKILHFIERYRTAYNKKDLLFVEKTLSDSALIIVGRVIQTKPDQREYLQRSFLDDDQIEFVKKTKSEYLYSLKRVFANNDFIKVEFDKIEIQRHPQHELIYGVALKQRWHSSTYSDEGYLFLMVDFLNPQEPIIHVRAWQPRPFNDGSTISLYDFEIID